VAVAVMMYLGRSRHHLQLPGRYRAPAERELKKMRQNTGPRGFPRQDDVTVSFNVSAAQSAPTVPDGVTV